MARHERPSQECRAVGDATVEHREHVLEFRSRNSLRQVASEFEQVGKVLQMPEIEVVVFREGGWHGAIEEPVDRDSVEELAHVDDIDGVGQVEDLGDPSQEGLVSTVHLVDSSVLFCEVLCLLGINACTTSHHPTCLDRDGLVSIRNGTVTADII